MNNISTEYSCGERGDCKMYDTYEECNECPDYPLGYPEGKSVLVDVNGKCWLATSTKDGNLNNPNNYIGNTDVSKPWVVLSHDDHIKWLISQDSSGSSGSGVTDTQVTCLENKLSPAFVDDTKLFEHFFTTEVASVVTDAPDQLGDPTSTRTPASLVTSATTPFTYTLNIDDPRLDFMDACHNYLMLTLVSQTEINGIDGNDASLVQTWHTGYADGDVSKFSGMAQSSEDSTTENDKSVEVMVPFDADGNISLYHVINTFPNPALLESGQAKFSVRVQGSGYSAHAPYTPANCTCA